MPNAVYFSTSSSTLDSNRHFNFCQSGRFEFIVGYHLHSRLIKFLLILLVIKWFIFFEMSFNMFLPIWSCVIWRIIIWIYFKFVNYHINFLLEKYSFVSFMCQKYLLSQRLFSSFLILSFYKILNFKLNKFINDFLCGLCCSCLL